MSESVNDFTKRVNRLFSDVFCVSTVEFSKITGFDRSYISHLRNGDRVLKHGRASSIKLSNAIIACANKLNLMDELCLVINIPCGSDKKNIISALDAWLFENENDGKEVKPGKKTEGGARRIKSNFAVKLNLLMELADISAVRLARSLNVDTSLISKYRSGVRVPKADHPIIREIARVLTGSIAEHDRLAGLADLTDLPLNAISDKNDASVCVESWLKDFGTVESTVIEKLLDAIDSFHDNHEYSYGTAFLRNGEIKTSDESGLYFGIGGLRRAVIRFLTDAVKQKEKELWLYSDQNLEWMIADKDFTTRWFTLMSEYLREGGRIVIIHNVDRGLEDLTAAISSWMPLYFSGDIESRYCVSLGGNRFSHTLFIAPQSAAISSVCIPEKEENAYYRYITDEKELDYSRILFKDLLSKSRPLLYMSRESSNAYIPEIINDKAIHLMLPSLSLGTMPEKLLKTILDRSNLSKEIKRRILSERASKKELMSEKISYGEVHECIPLFEKDASVDGKIPVDTIYAPLFYTQSEYREHLRAVFEISEREKGYNLYPIKEPIFERIKLVISGSFVNISSISGRKISFNISHPVMCRAFIDFAKKYEERNAVDKERLKALIFDY